MLQLCAQNFLWGLMHQNLEDGIKRVQYGWMDGKWSKEGKVWREEEE